MMKLIFFIGIIATMAIAMTAAFGLILATAQMADNASLGNATGNITMGTGNTTIGNSTQDAGKISSFHGIL